ELGTGSCLRNKMSFLLSLEDFLLLAIYSCADATVINVRKEAGEGGSAVQRFKQLGRILPRPSGFGEMLGMAGFMQALDLLLQTNEPFEAICARFHEPNLPASL